jgi:three-Cys-motif partner protein
MLEHVFGGGWTEIKLAALRNYLNAYRTVFTGNARAKFLKTWYVDAFAGTGSRSTGESRSSLTDVENISLDPDATAYLDGSAKIALSLGSPFDRYLFIEKSKARSVELRNTIDAEYKLLASRCEVKQLDANVALSAWSAERNWKTERAVVFLDPYGMQVDWETVRLLGRTKAVDLWYLFPLGVVRMLTRDGNIEGSWQKRLDILFGTDEWRDHFYKTESVQNLFGTEDVLHRDATVKNVQRFIESRLKTEFAAVAPSLVLKNSKSSPLFALCFAAANERVAPTALKIARSILRDDRE